MTSLPRTSSKKARSSKHSSLELIISAKNAEVKPSVDRVDAIVLFVLIAGLIVCMVLALVLSGCGTGFEIGHAHSEFCAGSTVSVSEDGITLEVPATVCVSVLTVTGEAEGETKTVACSYVSDSPAGTGYLPPPLSHERCTEAPGYAPFRLGVRLPIHPTAKIRSGFSVDGAGDSPADSGGSGSDSPGADTVTTP